MVFAGSDKDKGICAKILTVPYILLGNSKMAQKYIDKLSEEDQIAFHANPLCHFFEKNKLAFDE